MRMRLWKLALKSKERCQQKLKTLNKMFNAADSSGPQKRICVTPMDKKESNGSGFLDVNVQ